MSRRRDARRARGAPRDLTLPAFRDTVRTLTRSWTWTTTARLPAPVRLVRGGSRRSCRAGCREKGAVLAPERGTLRGVPAQATKPSGRW